MHKSVVRGGCRKQEPEQKMIWGILLTRFNICVNGDSCTAGMSGQLIQAVGKIRQPTGLSLSTFVAA